MSAHLNHHDEGMGISHRKFDHSSSFIYSQNAQFDVQSYLRLFDRREMLLTARVLAKASGFTIANALDATTLSIS